MTTDERTAPAAPELAWTSHPARCRPRVALLLTVFLILLYAGIWWSFRDVILTVLAVLLLTTSLAPFYLPTRYRIADDAVLIRTTFARVKKPLDLYRRLAVDRHGALLSPFDRPSRLDRFHGLNLRFDAHDRERVLEFLRNRFLNDDGRSKGTGVADRP